MQNTENVFLNDFPPTLVKEEEKKVIRIYITNKVFFGRFSVEEICYIRTLWQKRKHEITYCGLMEQIFSCSKFSFSRRFNNSLGEFKTCYVAAKELMDETVEIEVIKRFLFKEVPNADVHKTTYKTQKQLGKAA